MSICNYHIQDHRHNARTAPGHKFLSHCVHTALTLRSYCAHTALISHSHCTPIALTLHSYRAPTALVLRSHCAHTALTLQPFFALTLHSSRAHTALVLRSHCNQLHAYTVINGLNTNMIKMLIVLYTINKSLR